MRSSVCLSRLALLHRYIAAPAEEQAMLSGVAEESESSAKLCAEQGECVWKHEHCLAKLLLKYRGLKFRGLSTLKKKGKREQ
jgi:hypothetical protein